MRRFLPGLAPLLLLLTASPSLAQKEFGFDNRKPSGQPYLSPEETVRRMKVAPEFEVKLFAGEPQLVNPVAFTIDERGRVWAIECFEYPSKTPPGKAPRDRIVILEDTDGDGKCDKRTVFAEGKDFPVTEERKKQGLGAFDLASGLEVGHGGVYVGAPPYLWFIENKNDKPGKFEVLLKGFGSQDTHETLNTFQWGPDGWLYGMQGVFTHSDVKPTQGDGPDTRMSAAVWRFHPTAKKFEIFAEGTSNPWGLDWRNTDGEFILACCVIPHLFHVVPGGIYKRQAGQSENKYAYGYINEICDHTFHRESGWAHAGLISLDAPHIPKKYQNSVIFGSIHGCSIKQNVLKRNGSTFTASKGEDFLVSGDKNFRPINMKWGPLGDIYLIDWHDQNPCHQAKPDSWDYERGRVYRIQLKGTKPKKAEDLGKRSTKELVKLAFDDNPYRYRTALRLLGERSLKSSGASINFDYDKLIRFPMLMQWGYNTFENGKEYDAFLRQLPVITLAESHARDLAYRALGNVTHDVPAVLKELVTAAKAERNPTHHRELASAAIRLADKGDVTPLLHALMQHKEDANDPVIPHLVWYAYEKVLAKKQSNAELDWLREHAAGNPFVTDQIIPRTMRRLVATGRADDLARCVAFAGGLKDAAARRKALEGLTVALKDQFRDAPAGWAEVQKSLLAANDPATTEMVNKLAVSFRDPAALRRALATFGNAKLPADARAEALRQLVQLGHPDAAKLVQTALRRDAQTKVRAEAARQVAAFREPDIAAAIIRDWAAFPKAIRPELVNSLASRKPWARQLLQALADKTIDRADVTDNVITRIQSFRDKQLAALIEKSWGRTRPTPAELNKQIDAMRRELSAGPASFARGKVVFTNNCAKCHKFDGPGADVGPQLDGAGRDIEYILANVIDPNRVIGAPYFQRIAKTIDGRVEQGLLAAEDDTSITLKVENGVLKRIPKADLDGPVRVVEKSMMPEGLTAGMSRQDFRDLVRYVMANPFLTDVAVNGKAVPVSVTGRIPLPRGEQSRIETTVTALADVKTKLLLGGVGEFAVKLDGHPIGDGTSGRDEPDQVALPVTLSKGTHTLTIAVRSKTAKAAYARLLDPERKLRDADAGAKK